MTIDHGETRRSLAIGDDTYMKVEDAKNVEALKRLLDTTSAQRDALKLNVDEKKVALSTAVHYPEKSPLTLEEARTQLAATKLELLRTTARALILERLLEESQNLVAASLEVPYIKKLVPRCHFDDLFADSYQPWRTCLELADSDHDKCRTVLREEWRKLLAEITI